MESFSQRSKAAADCVFRATWCQAAQVQIPAELINSTALGMHLSALDFTSLSVSGRDDCNAYNW